MKQQFQQKLIVLLTTSVLSFSAHSAGFSVLEQSVTGLGAAFAGSAAVAEDASTIFFNPAGMTYLKQAEINIAAHYISADINFTDGGSQTPFGAPLLGGNGGDAADSAVIPNFYYSKPINDTTFVGIGIGAPFGLVTEYDGNWKGRYDAVKSDMRTININPSIAYKASEKFSIGFGVNAQKADIELTRMADLGARFGASSSQMADGYVNIKADDWSWGYNLGLTFQATDATRFGLAYRSKISHSTKGEGSIISTISGSEVADGIVRGKITVPESLSLAVNHQINKQWSIMADASWTRWSRFKEIAIQGSGTFPDSTTPENWSNTMRYGLGLSYILDPKWTFRTGIAYDESPISDQYRGPRVPGEDRTWLAVGASYKYSNSIIIDAGYSHIFVDDPQINKVDKNNYSLVGEYKMSIDILSIQMRWLLD